jgi:hypothetical protein
MSADVLLCAAAVIAWVWLVRVARVEWPLLKRMNDALGIDTAWYVRKLVATRDWLAPVGGLAVVVAAAVPEARAGIAAAALAAATLSMWCVNEKTRRLLLLTAGPPARGPDGWDDPGPDAPTPEPYTPRPHPPAIGQTVDPSGQQLRPAVSG